MSNATEKREVPRRLARPERQAKKESLQNEEGRPKISGANAPGGPGKKNPYGATIRQVAAAWLEAGGSKHKRRAIRDIANACGPIAPQAIHPAQITALFAKWKANLAQSTYHSYATEARNFLRTTRPDLLASLPKTSRGRKHYPAATADEIAKLIANANAWMRAILIIARSTAMRKSDCLALTANHVTGDTLTITQHKTKRKLTIPASPELLELIALAPGEDTTTPIVERYAGRPIGLTMFVKAWEKLRARTGVNPNLVLHSLRHTFAVMLYDRTHDVRVVQEMLGHANLNTTFHYLEHHDPARLRPILAQIWTPKGPVQ